MRFHAAKDSRGLPRYDGLGAAVSALGVSAATQRAAQQADAWLTLDDWGYDPRPAAEPGPAVEPGPAPFSSTRFPSLHFLLS